LLDLNISLPDLLRDQDNLIKAGADVNLII